MHELTKRLVADIKAFPGLIQVPVKMGHESIYVKATKKDLLQRIKWAQKYGLEPGLYWKFHRSTQGGDPKLDTAIINVQTQENATFSL